MSKRYICTYKKQYTKYWSEDEETNIITIKFIIKYIAVQCLVLQPFEKESVVS